MPVRPKPTATSSAIKQHVVAPRQLADAAQIAGRMHDHPGRRLHERLDHHGGDLVVLGGEQLFQLAQVMGSSAVE